MPIFFALIEHVLFNRVQAVILIPARKARNDGSEFYGLFRFADFYGYRVGNKLSGLREGDNPAGVVQKVRVVGFHRDFRVRVFGPDNVLDSDESHEFVPVIGVEDRLRAVFPGEGIVLDDAGVIKIIILNQFRDELRGSLPGVVDIASGVDAHLDADRV
jgi:hypothetical protein